MLILSFILVTVICLGAGFVGGKLYTEKALNHADLQKQLDDSQQQMNNYREDVSANLAVTQKLMTDMKSNYDSLVTQMETTTKLLERPRDSNAQFPFFGFDATEQLLATSDNRREKPRRRNENIQSQPSDYSDGSSGLFDRPDETKKVETTQ